MRILITGVAGFIGSSLARRILRHSYADEIIGVDRFHLDSPLKVHRMEELHKYPNFYYQQFDILDGDRLLRIFQDYDPEVVVHLAECNIFGEEMEKPNASNAYIDSNILAFYNILEACRYSYHDGSEGVKHLVFASSSSVYGTNAKVPYSADDKTDSPASLYAATKKGGELMAYAYARLYNIPTTGLRFFTVYGPAGRPDMACFGFADRLRAGRNIPIFNYGSCKRDFTYVDDAVEGIERVMEKPPQRKNGPDGLPVPPFAVYNIGSGQPENLLDFVRILSEELVRAGVLPKDYDFEAHKKLVPMQPGDVAVTYADTTPMERDFGFKPHTPLREGLRKFAEWYKDYYLTEKE